MIPDLAAVADVAHAHGVPLVVDSTMATPYLCRPIEHGADIVVHSVTKFIGGHGTSLGGRDRREPARSTGRNGRFPLMTEPMPAYGGLTWWGNFGEYGFLTRVRSRAAARHRRDDDAVQRLPVPHGTGDAGAPHATARGERPRRAPTSSATTRRSPGCYSGLPDSPWYDRAAALPPAGSRSGVRVRGARRASGGTRFIESVRLASHLANIGDARTLVIHPASTTHQQLSDDALAAAGVGPT